MHENEAVRGLATELARYLEQEEARLETLAGELAQLRAALVSGSVEQLEAAVGRLVCYFGEPDSLRSQRAALWARLPTDERGRIRWAEVEELMGEAAGRAVHRQRERVSALAQRVQADLRQVAVLAWFGQELYGRLLRALVGGLESVSQYDRRGTLEQGGSGYLLEILG
ncbi:MAG: hypothetical protein RMI91_06675 [Gemmatales bacterium]|nr:hypothetical protein [Gemmatales bacterium]MDW7994321.1 hypothetical protein [Gemmatales bacterium]